MLGWYCVIQVLDGYHHTIMDIFWRNKKHTSKLQAETLQYLAREKELVATKGEKCLVTTYREDGVEHKRSRLRPFVSIIVLCLSCLLCFTFCYLSWATLCDVVFSDYYESILFHVGSSAFEISTKLAVIVASCSVVAQ